MKYKEFVSWCNDRAADGCWDYGTATLCINVVRNINKLPFWKRKKAWKMVSDYFETNVVSVINEKIQRFKYGEPMGGGKAE